ncbi:MAG: FAD-dependent oxidoreductase [Clostridia bacterium]|nr:FAD-dependent oxidoreductase [Clostridia bacterium]
MEDIVIVGGGPAGLTAAIYVQRAGKHAVVLEGAACGGQILTTPKVVNYPAIKQISGADFALELYEQTIALGAEVRFVKAVSIEDKGPKHKVVHTTDGDIECMAIILATGSSNRKLGVGRENELLGKGVSYCATCDGMFFRGKDVAVVGGGNTAIEDAMFLSNYCRKVYLIHRRNELRGDAGAAAELEKKTNVEFVLEANVTKLVGENALEKIEITKLDGSKHFIDVSGLFIAVGQVPGNGAFANIINLDNFGYIAAGEDCKTNVEGIFVAGDARTKAVRQLTTAAGDGATAALAAVNYVR